MSKKYLFLVLLFSALLSNPIEAQHSFESNFEIIDTYSPKHVCKLPPTDINARFSVQSSPEVLSRIREKAQNNFEVDYFSSCDGEIWPEQAITAFEFALSIWSEHISSDVPIKVNAKWTELEGNTLGSARPSQVVQISGAGEPDTWYALAQLSALTGQNVRERLDGVEYDIDMNAKCNFEDWYFGTDAQVPDNKSDFVTVVLHEIGHGLGFLGTMSGDNQSETAE